MRGKSISARPLCLVKDRIQKEAALHANRPFAILKTALQWCGDSSAASSRRKRIWTGKLLVQLNDFLIAGQFFYDTFQFFASEGSGIVAHELSIFHRKLRIG